MLAGERMTGEDGVEVCLFPMDYMSLSQGYGPGTFSHCCGCPCDWASPNKAPYPVYAPFTGHVVARGQGTGNTLFYSSDEPVRTPSGDIYVSVQMTHAYYGSIPTKSHFTQGELIYYTGQQGLAYGDHLHLDQCQGQDQMWVGYGITCSGGNNCWALPNGVSPERIFFIDGRETIVSTGSMNFIIGDGTPVIGPTGDSAKMLMLMAGKIKKRRSEYGKSKSYTGGLFIH